jgi:formate dehydrogenase alpha subunit
MKKLIIDNRDVEVGDDSTILEAAEAAGVKIPTLCHDSRLTPYGACRMCLVEVEGQNKLLPACTSPAENGMVITTRTDRIERIRKTVLEFLCVHHPLDCPICDSAGECQLQDYVFEYKVGSNRFQGEKKKYERDTRNPLVERDLNRCILCAKCVRICREVQGVGAIGLVWRGFDTEVAPPFGQELDCEFCGQCIAVCPVGAMTNKLFKYRMRSWLLDKTESTCPHCSTGCSINVESRKGHVYRITSDGEKGINEGNLCSKGRFGFEFTNHPDRLTAPLVREGGGHRTATWEEALDLVGSRLGEIAAEHGPGAVAALASPRISNEENYLLAKIMRAGIGSNNIDSIAHWGYRRFFDGNRQVFGTFGGVPDFEALKTARTILVVESNVTDTNPVAGNFIIKAKNRGGARILVLSSRASKLTRHADLWVRQKPGTDAEVLAGMAQKLMAKASKAKKLEGFEEFAASVKPFTPSEVSARTGVSEEDLDALVDAYAAEGPALIVFTLHSAENAKGLQTYLAAAGLSLIAGHSRAGSSGLLVPGETCNIQGLLDVGAAPDLLPGGTAIDDEAARAALEAEWGKAPPTDAGLTAEEMIRAAEEGKLKALFVVGENPLLSFPDAPRVRRALEKLDFLVVQDLFLTETASLANVVLAAASYAEKAGTVTNAELRINRFRAGIEPHGDSWADWRILSALAGRLGAGNGFGRVSEITDELARVAPVLAAALQAPEGGVRWTDSCADAPAPRFRALSLNGAAFKTSEEYPTALLTGALLNHAGSVTRRGAGIMAVSPVAPLHLSEEDAADLGVKDGDRVKVLAGKESLEALAELSRDLSPGLVFLPVHFAEPNPNLFTKGAAENGERTPVAVKLEKA